jgi:hypothetical protein
VSEQPEKRRRDFLERLKYMLGDKRWLQLVEMAESGELEKQRRAFFEMVERDELEQCVKQFEFKGEFSGISNRN